MGTPLPLPQKGGRAPPILALVYCGETAESMKLVLGMEVGLSPDDFVLHGDPAPPQKEAEPPPQFSAHFYCGQKAGCIKMTLGMEVGLSPGDFVLDGDPAPLPNKGRSPHKFFSAHFYCGQTAGCIKMPIGMEVGLSPGDFVLHGNPSRRFVCTLVTWCKKALYKYSSFPFFPKNGRSPPIFGSRLLWPNGCIGHDNTWYRGRHWSTRHCVR